MKGADVTEKILQQSFRKVDVSASDVFAWLFRHAGYVGVLIPIISAVLVFVWIVWLQPRVSAEAERLDSLHIKPAIIRLDTLEVRVEQNRKAGRKTYYLVRKMEHIQRKQAPKKLVDEAEEEVKLEKILNDEEDK